jgi:hypothetical protein
MTVARASVHVPAVVLVVRPAVVLVVRAAVEVADRLDVPQEPHRAARRELEDPGAGLVWVKLPRVEGPR